MENITSKVWILFVQTSTDERDWPRLVDVWRQRKRKMLRAMLGSLGLLRAIEDGDLDIFFDNASVVFSMMRNAECP